MDAFVAAYDEHVWDVYAYFGYRLRDREEVEDLTQAAFERALKSWKRYDAAKGSVRSWLLAIARNLLIDHYRASHSRSHLPLEIDDLQGVVNAPDLGLDPEVEQALLALSDRQRELIALRFGGDLTGAEIGALTGLSVSNVQQILSRALRQMRAELDRSGVQRGSSE